MERPSAALPVRRTRDGYAATGPRFYVWEEDRRELLGRVAELQDARAPREIPPGSGHAGETPHPPDGRGRADRR